MHGTARAITQQQAGRGVQPRNLASDHQALPALSGQRHAPDVYGFTARRGSGRYGLSVSVSSLRLETRMGLHTGRGFLAVATRQAYATDQEAGTVVDVLYPLLPTAILAGGVEQGQAMVEAWHRTHALAAQAA